MAVTGRKKGVNAYLLVILSFALVILLGSFLLVMPFSQRSGKWAFDTYIDSLFASTSASCVTGLVSYKEGIVGTLSFTGQLIFLFLIQIGGLSFITLLTFIVTLFKSKLQFKDRYFLSQMVNATSFADVVKFVRKIIIISLSVELIGFLCGLPVFFTIFPENPLKAIWNSLFTSVSAFNNAGFDILGTTSLVPMPGTPIGDLKASTPWMYYYLLSYLMILIVLGGISFLVILDVFSFKKRPKQFRAFTKIVLVSTAFLIVVGTLLFYLLDGLKGENSMSLFDCLFQSVTLRTAGFASYDQNSLSTASITISCFLMFVGGSPLGTAGGVKTTTVFVVFIAMYCFLRGRPVTAFKRKYSTNMVLKAMSLIMIAFFACMVSVLIIEGFDGGHCTADQITFEVFSAFGTTGVSTGITTELSSGSKIVLIILMYLGRVGPMTFFQIFQKNINITSNNHYSYVEEDFLIG